MERKSGRAMSYYEVLSISPQASDEDIKRAYRKLALQYHPDRNPHNRQMYEKRFSQINEAYAHLKTRESRERYDRTLMAAQTGTKMSEATITPAAQSGSFFERIADIFRAAPPSSSVAPSYEKTGR